MDSSFQEPLVSLHQLAFTFSFAPSAVIAFDTQQRILFANSSTEKLLGFRQSQLIGKHMKEFVSNQSMVHLRKMSRAMILTQHTDRHLHVLTSEGVHDVFSFKVKSQVISSLTAHESRLAAPPKHTVFLVFLQKLNQDTSTAMLLKDKLLQLSTLPILGASETGIMEIFNEASEQTFGWTAEEAIGTNVKFLMPEKLAKYHDQFITKYLLTGRGRVIDKMRQENAIKKDGTVFPVELKMSYVDVGKGKPLFVGYARDRSSFITKNEQTQRAALADKIFPASIAARVCSGEEVICDYHDHASLLFCDIVGYTALSNKISAHRMVKLLDDIFSGFDTTILDTLNVEKLKTMGDCYMIGSGFPGEFKEHASELVNSAFKMMEVLEEVNQKNPDLPNKLMLRFGISSGPVVCGIVGKRKPLYDTWGATVNIASRMESTGVPGELQISKETYDSLTNPEHKALFHLREGVFVKGAGTINTFITNFTGHLTTATCTAAVKRHG